MTNKKIKVAKLSIKAPPKRRSEKCLKSKKLVCSDEVGPGWKDKNRFKV